MFEFFTILFAIAIISATAFSKWGPEGTLKNISKELTPNFKGAWEAYKKGEKSGG